MREQMKKTKKAMPFRRATAVAAALASAGLLSAGAGSAAAESSAPADAQATGYWRAYENAGFSGKNALFSGTTGRCVYVGAGWNDAIRSARTRAPARVELWDNANCTGGAITIDSEGYSRIGAWVSAYRVTYP
ncbi:peptidase inhibitor family I36 protein [Streptomyces sp. enrichment culture]|uniref:peptidase inhibitor family I36 protein n=1 Tax=Streptomyces sp. enrichment culture TaxID=1795815 RepID=UPI003F56564B